MENISKISLVQALPYLEQEQTEKINLFVNPSGQLETFFNYKGKLLEISKDKMRVDLGKNTIEEVGDDIRANIISGLRLGESIILHTGGSENFNLLEFFSKFSWFKKDFFENSNFLKAEYLKKNKMVKTEEDKDNFGNAGCYKCNQKAKIFVLTHVNFEEIQAYTNANPNMNFNIIYVE